MTVSETDTALVRRRAADGVTTLSLNRPADGNAMTQPLWEALHAALAAAAADEACRVIVVTGEGPVFCAGADIDRLRGFAEGAPADIPETRPDPEIPGALDLPPGFDDRWSYLARIPKPVIASLNGAAVGSGFALSMFCDIRFAARDAKLSSGFARLGLIGEMALPWILSRIAGPHVAADILFSARIVSGEEAAGLGLVNRAVERDRLAAEVQSYAAAMAREISPGAIRTMKTQLWRGLEQSLDQAVDEYYPAMAESFRSEDFRQRAAALLARLKA
ncbi:MAG: enoyl-CoA hydratase-related protein [Pikeienuella sp.]